MSKEETDVGLETEPVETELVEAFTKIIVMGFPAGNITLKVTPTMAALISDAFMSGTRVGITGKDAELMNETDFVAVNGNAMQIMEIQDYVKKAEFVQVKRDPRIILPGTPDFGPGDFDVD